MTVDLSTFYLGFELPHPLMVGASPLVDDLDAVKKAEDAGAAAIVMHSLFEEQLTLEQMATHRHIDSHTNSYAEALSYFPEPTEFALGPEEYLEQIRRIKETVGVPVLGSLNGKTDRGWLEHARLIEEAGADALELNVYDLPVDVGVSAEDIEQRAVRMVENVTADVTIPVTVKLSPFYSALPHFAKRLEAAGARGLVLFNRFYEADIDVDELELEPRLRLSDPAELYLRLRWLAVLWGRVGVTLAVSGGVHKVLDAVKAIMAGAHGVQMVSALLSRGPEYLATMKRDLAAWLEEHEYDSLKQMQGSMSFERCPDPTAYKRANYVRILQGWRERRLS